MAHHETVSVLGRSGNGKTTLLKIIAGLERADRGELLLNGRRIDGVPSAGGGVSSTSTRSRSSSRIWAFGRTWPSACACAASGWRARAAGGGDDRQPGARRARPQAPNQISGGQRQRVSFGRALIVQPSLLLLDEPFGNLDAETRACLQALVKRVAPAYRITSLFVSHDLKEAILMGNRFAHLKAGRLRVFENLEAFAFDPDIGVLNEVRFWESLAPGRKLPS